MFNLFSEINFYWDGNVCINFGWETNNVLITLDMSMKFYNCYTVLIESLCDLTNWTGSDNSKLFDECNASDDEQVNLYNYVPL